MRLPRPFPALAGLAVPAALALFGADPALAQDPPPIPMACTAGSRTGQAITSVSSTETSITVNWSQSTVDYGGAFAGAAQICDGSTIASFGNVSSGGVPIAATVTYTTFGTGDSAPALTAATDYWMRFNGYGDGQAWVYIRTAGSSGSVSLALNSAGTDSTYHNGEAIEITATFGESVTVTGTPRIPMTIGSTTRNATYSSGSPGTELVFSYTVQTADVDTDGIAIAENALGLNGGTINLTTGGTAAERDHGAVAASTAHKVDGRAASVSSIEFINLPTGNGNYVTIGDSIELKVTFDRPVTVTGTPRIELSPAFGAGDPKVTRHANYRSGSGTTALVFRYELQDGDDSGTTQVVAAANKLALNGGTIRTGAADASLTNSGVGSTKTVSAHRPRIDRVTINAVGGGESPSADADLDGSRETFVKDQVISVSVEFDQDLARNTQGNAENMQIVLKIGSTTYPLSFVGNVGQQILRFQTHTVLANDRDDDGITIERQSATNNVVKLSGGAYIRSTAANGGNDADLTLTADPKVVWPVNATTTVESLNVRGTNAVPVSTNFTVATPTDTDRAFAQADFAFTDSDGDPLKEIQIVTLPASAQGTLELSDASFTVPKTIAKDDIGSLEFKPAASFTGDATFTFKVVDSFGAASSAASTATVRVGANVALSFNSAGPDDTYMTGDAIEITATFAQAVSVTGTPRIEMTVGTATRYATYVSGGGTNALLFRYTVVAADVDTDGISVAANALQNAGGSTIRHAGTSTNAALDHDAVAANAARKVNVAAPEAPAAPAVSETDGTSITVTWTAPANTRPTITDYDVQYRRKGATDWTEVTAPIGTATTVTISSLVRGASYEAQVRATNDEGTSDWSATGSGHTGPARFVSATTNAGGQRVTFTFTKDLLIVPPDKTRFIVSVDSDHRAPALVGVAGGVLWLTLADAITHGQIVTVEYSTTQGSGNKMRDADGLEMGALNFVSVTNAVPAPVPVPGAPSVAMASSTSITVSWTAPSATPAITDYDVQYRRKGDTGWTEVTDAIGTAVMVTVSSLVQGASYEAQVRATNSDGTSGWSATGSGHTGPAKVVSATTNADGTEVDVTFTKTVSTTGLTSSSFTVTAGGTDQNAASIGRAVETPRVVSLGLTTAVTSGQTVTVGYTKPAGAKLTDEDGLEVANFSGQSVTNTLPTVFESATTNAAGTEVIITFTAPVKRAGDGYLVAAGPGHYAIDEPEARIESGRVHLALIHGTIAAGETVRVTYTKPGGGFAKLTDNADRELDSFGPKAVNNAVPVTVSSIAITSDPGPDRTYQAGDRIQATVTFSAAVTVTTAGTPVEGPRIKFKFQAHHSGSPGDAPHLVYESGSGTNQLVFGYTVASGNESPDGIAIPASAFSGLRLNGGAIRTGSTDATLTHGALGHDPNHKVHGPTPQDTTAPALSTTTLPAVDTTSLVMTFDEGLDGTGTAPAASAFTVKVNQAEVDLADTNSVVVSGTTVTLTLAEAVIDADRVTVAYDKPSENPIQDFTAGNDAATFGDQQVTNNTAGVAPTVLTDPAPVVGGTRLVITFSENLDESSTPAASAFPVTVASSPRDVSSVAVSGATVTLTLASAAVFGETVTVSYTQPTGATDAKLRDRAPTPNLVASFGPLDVTNNDNTAPSFSSAAVDGAALVLTFDEHLDGTSKPAASAFPVRVAGSPRTVSNVELSEATVTLTLAPPVAPGQTVTVRYDKPAANPLQDGATNQVDSFGQQTATNDTRAAVSPATSSPAVTSSPAEGDTYGLGEHIELAVRFSHAVTVTGTPQLELEVGSNNRQAAYNRGSGSTALVFRYTVAAADADADGISVAANRLTLNGGAIRDGGNGAATLTHAALATQAGHKVDGTLTRTTVSIAVAGGEEGEGVSEGEAATFTLTASPAPAADITVNLTVAQGGSYVAAANLGAQTVTVPASGSATYSVPTVNDNTDEPNGSVTVTVQTGAGYTVGSPAAASVTVNDNDQPVTPVTPSRPAFSRAAVNGTALTITFNRTLDAGSAPAGSAFTVTATPAGGSARAIQGTGTASVSGSTVTVTLAEAVAAGETVRVSYAAPSTNPLRGAGSSGREVTNFSGRSVANDTSGPSAPPPGRGTVSGSGATVTLDFGYELDASSTPDPGDFTVTVAAASSDAGDASAPAGGPASPQADDHYRVTAVSIAGSALELTISPPVPEDREAVVGYTPGARPLRTAAGAAVPNFNVTVPAATPPPPPPPPPTNRPPAFESSEYAFELREHVDGSVEPVGLGEVAAADPDGDALSYALAAGDASRFAVGAADGAVSYTGPGEDFETGPNAYELTVRASDPEGASAEARVTVTVIDVIELPVAADDAAATDEDVAVTVDVLANDTDWAGEGLRVVSVSAPEQGTAEVAADGGAVLYTPEPNWHGTDRFTYAMEDGSGETAEAAVVVTVRSVNDVPEAAADTASTDEDVAVEVAVLANDTDVDGDSLRVASVSAPANGTAAIAAGAVLYTPDANWHGTDRFTYTVGDGNGGTAEATVEVTVRPVNDAPAAADDAASTNEDEAVTVDVLANDTDPDGDGLRLASVSAPENGTARIAAGVVLYMPAANFHGTDRFTYVAEDGNGGTASAAVTVTVLATNDAPMAVGTIPAQSLEEGGDPARIELSPFFEDADGDVLAYGTVSSDSAVVRATVAGSVLTLVPAGYGRVVVVVAARDAGGLTATQALAVSVSDGAARETVSHALAGLARSHLASARMTLGRRPLASRSDASRLSLMGRDVPLGLDAAKSAAEQRWQGWLSGIASRAMSQATGGGAPDSAARRGGAGDDMTLGDLFRFGDLVGDLTRFDGGRDPLRGSEFQFAFGGRGGQESGDGAHDAAGGGGGGLRLQLWGQGDVQTFRGAPSDGNDYDGELQTGYVGLDTWLGSRFMLGVAVARSRGTGDWRTGATSGSLETRLVAVHPYLQWNSGATSIWAMAGAGHGDADNVRDGNGLAETSDLGLRMGLVELRRRLAAGGGFSLALRADAGWAELQTETGSETLDGQTAAVDQLRFGAELSQQIRLGGLTLNPFGEAHVRRDGGAGQPGTGLELIGGLKARAGFLRIDAQGRMLAVHSASGYEEQGFSATLSLGNMGGRLHIPL